MNLSELKKVYNKTIAREKKAERFIASANEQQLNTWLPEFNKIIIKLSLLMDDYEKLTGNKITLEEVTNGFKEEK